MNRPVYVFCCSFLFFYYVFRSNVSNVISSQKFPISICQPRIHDTGHSLARSISMGTQPYARRFMALNCTWCRSIKTPLNHALLFVSHFSLSVSHTIYFIEIKWLQSFKVFKKFNNFIAFFFICEVSFKIFQIYN